jgi:hypothetical protein
MSLEELYARNLLHKKVKIFINENMNNFTLDKIIYNSYSIIDNRVIYDKSFIILNNKTFKCKIKVNYSDINNYFIYREQYKDIRKRIMKLKVIYSPSLFEFIKDGRRASHFYISVINSHIKKG